MRIRSSTRWVQVGGKSAALVLSILLAFAIDRAWEKHQTTHLESEWLAQLNAELQANLIKLDERIQQNDTGIDRFEWFMRTSPDSLAGLPPDSARAWLYDFSSTWTYDAARGVSTTLSDPAAVITVRDPNLKRLVVDWLGLLDDLQEEASSMWGAGGNVVQILADKRFQGAVPAGQRPTVWNSAANSAAPVLPRLRSDDAFVAALTVKVYYQVMYLSQLRSARAVADSASVLIKQRGRTKPRS